MLFTLARLFLILDALIFTMVGGFLFTGPTTLEYLNIDSGAGVTAIRTWGGSFIGLGIVGLIAACKRHWVPQGLVTILIIGGMIVLTRIYGIAVDGLEPKQTSELMAESLGPLLAAFGLICVWLDQRRENRA